MSAVNGRKLFRSRRKILLMEFRKVEKNIMASKERERIACGGRVASIFEEYEEKSLLFIQGDPVKMATF